VTTPSDCNTAAFNSSDPLTGLGDWDPGYYKAECPAGWYTQGVSQSTSGALNSLLCCPINTSLEGQTPAPAASGSTCTVQTVYNQNSSAYSPPDWDYGFYKAECPGGQSAAQYVAGVSAFANGSGIPHAILCCTQ